MSDDAKREREDGAEAAAAAEAPSPKAARADDADAAAAPATDAPAAAAAAPKERPNGKKRKVVVLLGYVGAGYQGMQRNPGAKTIEDELERAFHAAGGISNENMGDFSKIQWTRAARTDKGVSAVGQAVALKLCLEPPGVEDRINAALPPNFRVFGVTRVTSGFNAKNLCDRRRYKYVLPEWAFDAAAPATAPADGSSVFRLGADGLARLNALLGRFVGTHNFHNYTVRVRADAPAARRYILSFAAAEPQLVGGERLVTLTVLGQSFMLHQIRKMVGTALAIMRGALPEAHLARALEAREAVSTPMAPELGLYLAECIFHAYSERYADTHAPLSLGFFEPAPAEFERDAVLPHIVSQEAAEGTLREWLRSLDARAARGDAEGAGGPENEAAAGGAPAGDEVADDAGGGADDADAGGSDSEGGGGGGGGRGRGGGRRGGGGGAGWRGGGRGGGGRGGGGSWGRGGGGGNWGGGGRGDGGGRGRGRHGRKDMRAPKNRDWPAKGGGAAAPAPAA